MFVAIFAPLIAPYEPDRAEPRRRSRTAAARARRASTSLGVDDLGRDELSRLIYGARYSLLIGVVAVTVGLTIGLLLGAVAGYFRRARQPDHAA